jgi:hypothetical protein
VVAAHTSKIPFIFFVARFGRRESGSAHWWPFSVNNRNKMGRSMYPFDCLAESCGKHPDRCFAQYAYTALWLWQSPFRKHPLCFKFVAYSSGKLLEAQTNTPRYTSWIPVRCYGLLHQWLSVFNFFSLICLCVCRSFFWRIDNIYFVPRMINKKANHMLNIKLYVILSNLHRIIMIILYAHLI